MSHDLRIGILALQGDVALHAELLRGLGVDVQPVRRVPELDEVDGLVLPGGESTTITRLLRINGLLEPLRAYAARRPLLGTCAGCILMASHLEDAGGVEPLGLLDIDVRRNGYGRQVDSFETPVELLGSLATDEPSPPVSFIRAPRILRVGEGVEVVGVHEQEPVAVRSGDHLALTFHPEVAGVDLWHRAWVEIVRAAQ